MNIGCFIGIDWPENTKRSLDDDSNSKIVARFVSAAGLTVTSRSPFHVALRAEQASLERLFGALIVQRGQFPASWSFRTAPRLPGAIALYVKCVHLEGPTKAMASNWPDPSTDFMATNHIDDKLRHGASYDPANNTAKPCVLFMSEIRYFMGAASLPTSVVGSRTDIYMIDSGVDKLNSPFFVDNSNMAALVEVLGVEPQFDGLPGLAGDLVGHGTLCAAAALNIARGAKIRMLTVAKVSGNNSVNQFGLATSVQWLSGLARCLSLAWKSIGEHGRRPIFAFSTGFQVDMTSPNWDSVVLFARSLLNLAWRCGIIVVSASGNAASDVNMVPFHVFETLSVGGAFPVFRDKALNNEIDWVLGGMSQSGKLAPPFAPPEPVQVDDAKNHWAFPDVCGIIGGLGGKYGHGTKLSHVYLCLPTAKGAPTAISDVAVFLKNAYGPAWDQMTVLQKAVAIAWAMENLAPLDNKLHEFTEQTDGWLIVAGSTSFSAPTVAGVLALILQDTDILPFGVFGVNAPGRIIALRHKLFRSCMDVEGGKSASGTSADEGIDGASGLGVLSAYLLWNNRNNEFVLSPIA